MEQAAQEDTVERGSEREQSHEWRERQSLYRSEEGCLLLEGSGATQRGDTMAQDVLVLFR